MTGTTKSKSSGLGLINKNLMATAAVLTTLAAPAPAHAQTRPSADEVLNVAGRCHAAGVEKPRTDGQLLMQANEVVYDHEARLITARGQVELAYYDCLLLADELTYQQNGDVVDAKGKVTLIEPSGYTVYADQVSLSGGLETGVINQLGAVLDETVKIAAAQAERKPGKVSVMKNVVFSPCEVCEGDEAPPLWQIQAVRVTHDEHRKTITYRHAILQVRGVPVLYLPYFAHADPTVARKSGFLVPNFGNSTDLGNFAEIPFYWALSPHHDLTISPLITTQEGVATKAEYRRRTRHGTYTTKGSFVYADLRDDQGNSTGEKGLRNHLFADGRFAINQRWRWGYDIKIASDDTYLKRFEIADEDRLTSNLYAEGIAGRDYAAINSFYFQGLREEDDPGTTPFVLPLAEAKWYLKQRPLKGTVWFNASALGLRRSEGADSYRTSFSSNWERQEIVGNGAIVKGFATARADLYVTDDQNLMNEPDQGPNSDVIMRAQPTIGAEWRWPFARTGGRFYQVIEPIAQVIVSPYGGNEDGIPNEDSANFEFDDTNLFTANKLPGLDLWETGPRANVGIRYGVYGPYGGQIDFVFGQNFRLKEDTVFDPSTGLGDQRSEYVGRLVFSPNELIDITHRFRINKDDYSFSRNEVNARIGRKDYWSRVSYVNLTEELSESGLEEREEVAAEARLKIYKNWYFEGEARRDLANANMISSRAALVFENECTELRFQFKRRFTRDRDIEPSSSFNVRIRLRTFGETKTR